MKEVYFEDLYHVSGWSFTVAIVFLLLLPWLGIFAKIPASILLIVYLLYSKRTLSNYLLKANPSWQAKNDIDFEQTGQMVSGAIAIVLTLAANLDPGPMQSVWLGAIICIMMATISWWLGETAFKSARSCGILTPDPPKHSPKSFRNEVLNPDGTAL